MIKHLILGFLINFSTSIDDALTNVPVLSSVTKTRKGRIAFSIGTILSVTLALVLSILFAQVLHALPNINIIVGSLVLLMAIAIYFNMFSVAPPKKIVRTIQDTDTISQSRFYKLVGLGFVMSFITVTDDIFALAPLFLRNVTDTIAAVIGVYLAAIALIIGVVYFAERIAKIPRKRELASITLVIFSLLLFAGIV